MGLRLYHGPNSGVKIGDKENKGNKIELIVCDVFEEDGIKTALIDLEYFENGKSVKRSTVLINEDSSFVHVREDFCFSMSDRRYECYPNKINLNYNAIHGKYDIDHLTRSRRHLLS